MSTAERMLLGRTLVTSAATIASLMIVMIAAHASTP